MERYFLILYAIIGVIAFFAYGIDRYRAKHDNSVLISLDTAIGCILAFRMDMKMFSPNQTIGELIDNKWMMKGDKQGIKQRAGGLRENYDGIALIYTLLGKECYIFLLKILSTLKFITFAALNSCSEVPCKSLVL